MKNHLQQETSPYLLQHVNNPVDWYPWCEEAFVKAKREEKPVFLSIGYSTCHWCHVMAHESFEDEEIADILNKYYVAIKVDKEERPDIDSIYMAVCQAFTGSGGWPTTIFLTPDQKPFFAGTYFPKTARYGQAGLKDLLLLIHDKWENDQKSLRQSAEKIVAMLKSGEQIEWDEHEKLDAQGKQMTGNGDVDEEDKEIVLLEKAFDYYKKAFDANNGGFGGPPKFPTPHNLFFLMQYYEKTKDEETMKMVEKTLHQMYRGGMFDHIGGGFSRYSTDEKFLVPHFEKMLYDNALLILAYSKAYQLTKDPIYRQVAEKTAAYILREMTSPEGGFYSAQDADSEGVEGKYYLFEPEEIIRILGEPIGEEFNLYFDISREGNFEGKSIPNLLHNPKSEKIFDPYLPKVYEYRKKRYALHLDDKILTSWNGLMIAAMCQLYRVTEDKTYLKAAIKAQEFISNKLCENDVLAVSWRKGIGRGKGFLDDYAFEIFALLALYQATWDGSYLEKVIQFCNKAIANFCDEKQGGFYLYGKENEQLIFRPKETYDGAIFSGNSAMAYNLVQLYLLTGDKQFGQMAERQINYLSKVASRFPSAHAMFLVALSDYFEPPKKMTIVVKDKKDLEGLPCRISLNTVVRVLENPTSEYLLKNDKTTFYVCRDHSCQPPVNELEDVRE